MCGIVGCAGKLNTQEERAFTQLLIVDQLRGKDSTGVLKVERNGKMVVDKEVGLPENLISKSDIWTDKRQITNLNKVLLGHNRAATLGIVNKINAHPFTHDHITGVHNGTIASHSLDQILDNDKFDVDSDNIMYSISKIGISKTYSTLVGAMALVWWDEDTEQLNFIRNDERPLFYCFTKDKSCVFWASEAWMLESILKRNHLKHGTTYLFEKNMHYKVKLEGTLINNKEIGITVSSKKLVEGVRQIKTYNDNRYNNYSNFGYGSSNGAEIGHSNQKYIGKEVDIYNLEEVQDVSNSSYYIGSALDPLAGYEEITVKVFKNELTKKLLNKHNWDGFYRGKIYAASAASEAYLITPDETFIYKDWSGYTYPNSLEDSETGTTLAEEIKATTLFDKNNPIYHDNNGNIISKGVFKHKTKNGCCWCGETDLELLSRGIWVNPTDILCHNCDSTPQIKNELVQYIN